MIYISKLINDDMGTNFDNFKQNKAIVIILHKSHNTITWLFVVLMGLTVIEIVRLHKQ